MRLDLLDVVVALNVRKSVRGVGSGFKNWGFVLNLEGCELRVEG